MRWLRAKRWITSPDPEYARKRRRDRLIGLSERNPGWVLSFEDETWWSRLALPSLHAWGEEDEPLRLEQRSVAEDDSDSKAISCCYGLYLPGLDEQTWLRFVNGRPMSGATTHFLSWRSEELAEAGKKVLVLVLDNAIWHVGVEVRVLMGAHNRQVKKGEKEGVRIIIWF